MLQLPHYVGRKPPPLRLPKKTELLWEGKYILPAGATEPRLRPVPRGFRLPFQTIEYVNSPRTQMTMFDSPSSEGWHNRLIWGDNLLVMDSLMEEFAGKINLIYIDPPFDVGADFSLDIEVGDGKEIHKEPSVIEEKAYRDTWGKGTDSYLNMMFDRLVLMKDLLADNGSIYVHLDWHVGHYVKIMMDEIFGKDNFRNEIVWHYRRWTAGDKQYQKMHDTLLFYSKTDNFYFDIPYEPYGDWIKKDYQYIDEETGKRWRWHTVKGNRYKVFLDDENKGVKSNDVCVIPYIVSTSNERTGYDTQKPEKLLERVIKASSNEGDLVADFFCGSGTTGAVAERINRKWIMCDLGRFAIHTTRKRLLDLQDDKGNRISKPFVVQNLGKYERRHWQGVCLEKEVKDYIKFIVELYGGKILDGFQHIHGTKKSSYIHIGATDIPVTEDEVFDVVREVASLKVKNARLDILGWEWGYGLDSTQLVKRVADEHKVDITLLNIPKEVMDKRAVERGDIHFYELGGLEVEVEKEDKCKASLKITNFIFAHYDLIPEEARDKIRKWQDAIDYWRWIGTMSGTASRRIRVLRRHFTTSGRHTGRKRRGNFF